MSWLTDWGFWLLVVAFGIFGIHEGWALATGNQTLTAYVRANTARFPIIIFILGVLVGWAAMHFWGGSWCGV